MSTLTVIAFVMSRIQKCSRTLPIHYGAVPKNSMFCMNGFLGKRMLGCDPFIHLDAEARRFRNLPRAIDHLDRRIRNLGVPRNRSCHLLLNYEIRRGDVEVQSGDAGQWS